LSRRRLGCIEGRRRPLSISAGVDLSLLSESRVRSTAREFPYDEIGRVVLTGEPRKGPVAGEGTVFSYWSLSLVLRNGSKVVLNKSAPSSDTIGSFARQIAAALNKRVVYEHIDAG